jgi:hypothetical protein
MKKVLAVLLASIFVSAMVFAQDAPAPAASVEWGSWSRMGTYLAGGNSVNGYTGYGTFPNWAGVAPIYGRLGLEFRGNSKNVGFVVDIYSNGATPTFNGDNAYVWVNIADVIKVKIGQVESDALRGKFDDFGAAQMYSAGGADDIFKRFYPREGVVLEITPVEGLFIGTAFDGANNYYDSNGNANAGAVFGAM